MNRALPWIAAAALALVACHRPEPAAEAPRPVITQVVAPGAPSTRDVYSGEIRARTEADVAFRVGGKLVARPVDAGARVTRGQVLARLDPEDARLSAQAAAAQLAAAAGDLALARAELDRHTELLAKKFISPSAFDLKQNAFNAARSRVEQARSQASLGANQAAYTTLTADSDGVVLSVAAEPGQVVAAGQPMLRLARAGEKEVVLNAPESQLARFRIGDRVTVSLWSDPGTSFPGRIRELAGGADPVTRTYAVRIAAIDPPATAQLGMTANVLLPSSHDGDLVLLPLAAVTREGGNAAVWVVDRATNQVQPRPVTVGQFREDGVTIISGLRAGDVVVTAGVHKLRAGQVVRLAAAPAPAPPR